MDAETAAAAQMAPNGWPQTLLVDFRAGHREALTKVYELHAPLVAQVLRHGFAFSSRGQQRRFVGYRSAFEFQDALHETFRRAFEPRARLGYDGIRPYGPYLATIARNVVLRSFRAREVLFPAVGEDQLQDEPAVVVSHELTASPERQIHEDQVRSLVDRFLDTLDQTDRRLVELRFRRGLSQRDAAAELGLGRQRIRTRELKVRKQLLAFLHERGESGLVSGALAVWLGAELASTLARSWS
ncbi:MAG: sigma-70 family RNA polymerase sigma factor [Myxococcales bacterium FL481]|nr:MAG: sigma-70 family RNA polymerase sigma factor [Myxococcales bacterium FL481]